MLFQYVFFIVSCLACTFTTFTSATQFDTCKLLGQINANSSSSLCDQSSTPFCWYAVANDNGIEAVCMDKPSCQQLPCLYGGLCENGHCFCPEGFQGNQCEKLTSEACVLHLCENDGVCERKTVGSESQIVCTCPYGYGGTLCQSKTDWTYLGYASAYKALAITFGVVLFVVLLSIVYCWYWGKKQAKKAREHYEDIPKTITEIVSQK